VNALSEARRRTRVKGKTFAAATVTS
jgi:hypothetical protein